MRIGKTAKNRNLMQLRKFVPPNRISGNDNMSHVKKGRITEIDGNIILGLLILSIVLSMMGILGSTGNLS